MPALAAAGATVVLCGRDEQAFARLAADPSRRAASSPGASR
jgi:hypothetical protein